MNEGAGQARFHRSAVHTVSSSEPGSNREGIASDDVIRSGAARRILGEVTPE